MPPLASPLLHRKVHVDALREDAARLQLGLHADSLAGQVGGAGEDAGHRQDETSAVQDAPLLGRRL